MHGPALACGWAGPWRLDPAAACRCCRNEPPAGVCQTRGLHIKGRTSANSSLLTKPLPSASKCLNRMRICLSVSLTRSSRWGVAQRRHLRPAAPVHGLLCRDQRPVCGSKGLAKPIVASLHTAATLQMSAIDSADPGRGDQRASSMEARQDRPCTAGWLDTQCVSVQWEQAAGSCAGREGCPSGI